MVWYYPSSKVDELLATSAKVENYQPACRASKPEIESTKTERVKPARAKHQRWRELREAGLSWGEIAQRHKDETGEEITREAVILALQRLKNPE
jgi:hypothetical protein